MQRFICTGNLTKDVELQTTQSGISVARFTLAVARKFSTEDGEQKADFFNIVVWRQQAENCYKYLKKGSKCGIVGSLQNRSYEAQDGTKRYVTEITADEVEFLSPKAEEREQKPTETRQATMEKLEPINEDNLPF